MPYPQILEMQCTLQGKNIDTNKYRAITIPGSILHASAYWRDFDGQVPQKRVRDDVFDFFAAHMSDPP